MEIYRVIRRLNIKPKYGTQSDSVHCCFLSRLINTFDFTGDFKDRTVLTQGGYQAAGMCVSIVFGVVGGAIVGEFGRDSLASEIERSHGHIKGDLEVTWAV